MERLIKMTEDLWDGISVTVFRVDGCDVVLTRPAMIQALSRGKGYRRWRTHQARILKRKAEEEAAYARRMEGA